MKKDSVKVGSPVNEPRDSATKSSISEIPRITLPKGGGAIKGIDEKFSVNSANGTMTFSIPLPFSPSRNEFLPSLSLNYNSGAGNSIFGLGWNADPPAIARRTDRKLPLYHDAEESDTFLFSGSEDLVPALVKSGSGSWVKDEKIIGGTRFIRYKPRIERDFARIEKISAADGNVFWKVTSRANVTSVFGKSRSARIFDPDNDSKIFKWLLEFSYDDKGNCFQLEYETENNIGIPAALHEKNRLNHVASFTNRYLKRIKYCPKAHFDRNSIAFNDWENFLKSNTYLLELVFDYGDHDPDDPQPAADRDWRFREDAFSDYRAGFEIRTCRLCRRVLMFHHFQELGQKPCLVRSLELDYDAGPAFTFLKSAVQKGFIRKQDGAYTQKSLPPVEFSYEPLAWNTEIKSLPPESLDHLPVGIDDQSYSWIDFYGEGLSGILTEQSGGWFYKQNLGEGNFTGAKLISPKPSLAGLSTRAIHLQDIEANGQPALVSNDLDGFFELSPENQWMPFKAFTQVPNIDPDNSDLRFLDLDGDGRSDMIVSEEDVFTWYQSKGKEGFEPFQTVRKNPDEEKGPNIVFSNQEELIALVDMNGDGLTDIVRIRNRDIAYWPNIGYGRFGAKVSMSSAPVFDYDSDFNPAYLKFADLDGSGTTDIVYLGRDSFQIYFNQSGNSWNQVNNVAGINPVPFPKMDDHSNVHVIDLLGNGVGCIVWSSALPGEATRPVRYIDLMNSRKPHLMTAYKNNMGKEVSMEYKSSTFYYLEDLKNGAPWITKLPFPVHCIHKSVAVDRIAKTRFTRQYTYHHGFYDYHEREFRGFGRVDQTDTEDFEKFKKLVIPGEGVQIVDEGHFQPPVLTRTWFHTGAFLESKKVLDQFAHEYFKNEIVPEKLLDEPDLPPEWTPVEWREALRSCKGLPLRVEVYSRDRSEKENIPYSTAQHTCHIQQVQPKLANRFAVFLTLEKEELTYSYERNPADPRIAHNMNIETDEFGNALKSAAVNYGRKTTDPLLSVQEQAEQSKTHVIFSENLFTNKIDDEEDHLLPVLYETKTHEITGLQPQPDGYFSIEQIRNDFQLASPIAFHDLPVLGQKEKRLINDQMILFYQNDLTGPLPAGVIESLLLPYQSLQLALTPDLVQNIFGGKVTQQILIDECKYVLPDGAFWIPSGIQKFDPVHFYQVIQSTDPFGNSFFVSFDPDYHLFVEQTTDALQNRNKTLAFNFRTLSPYLAMDENDNRTGARMDELGMTISSFVMGKENEMKGDLMDILSIETSPVDRPWMTQEYDFFNFKNTGNPNFVKTEIRETHHFDALESGLTTRLQTSFSYLDGGGNEILRKIQAEPGIALQENDDGTIIEVDTTPDIRWIGSGRTILNNKGAPVMQYEPYFSATFAFEDAKELVERGVTIVNDYDPMGRTIKTAFPNGTFSKVAFDSWKQLSFDPNDTVLESQWYKDRIIAPVPGIATPAEIDAATKTEAHANTPAVSYLDSLGRNLLSIADNGIEGKLKTTTEWDIQGNIRKITDPRGNRVAEYKYDMLGNLLYQWGMDAGERWTLNDVAGKPLRNWDNRDHEFCYEYDELQRPASRRVKGGDGPLPLDNVFEKIIYGETLPDNKTKNLRRKPVIVYDTAGKLDSGIYDFKGNILITSRRFTTDYKTVVNWTIPNPDGLLESQAFTTTRAYDALNRVIRQVAPDNNVYEPEYNEAGLLERVMLTQNGIAEEFVKDMDYNAKGQRERIVYGNNIFTKYFYDKNTFRLARLETKRINNDPLQDLNYTYDPVGNISRIEDKNIPAVFFNNQKIEGVSAFTYDAVYRLKEATGREHAGQLAFGAEDNWNDLPFLKKHNPNSVMEWRNYSQRYQYDAAGNILQMKHIAGTGSWTRDYLPDAQSNRLLSTTIGSTTYSYLHHIQHGFITAMPHLEVMAWNFKEELQAVARQNVTNGLPETTYYIYDGNGNRSRKITERAAPAGVVPVKKSERIYVDGIEVYREYGTANQLELERQTCHILDDTARIAMIETRTVGFDESPERLVRFQCASHNGSSSMETDESGRVISYEEFHPFGTTSYQANDAVIKAAFKRYRYTGMERDEESGLEYHGARYYLPWLGRWLNCDPAGIAGGFNLYSYGYNNPVNRVDRLGTQPEENSFLDIFTFIRNEAGFRAGSSRPLNFSSGNASPFGTAAHAEATNVLSDMQDVGVCRANQVYSEVAVNRSTGVVTQIGGSPIKGNYNLDLVAMPDGSPRLAPNQSVMTAGSAEIVGDIKYGGGKISTSHSAFGRSGVTVNAPKLASPAMGGAEIDFSVEPTTRVRTSPVSTAVAKPVISASELIKPPSRSARIAGFMPKGIMGAGIAFQIYDAYQMSKTIDEIKKWGEEYRTWYDAELERAMSAFGGASASAEVESGEEIEAPPPPVKWPVKPKKSRAEEAREAMRLLGWQIANARRRAMAAPVEETREQPESSPTGYGVHCEMTLNPFYSPTGIPYGPQPMYVYKCW